MIDRVISYNEAVEALSCFDTEDDAHNVQLLRRYIDQQRAYSSIVKPPVEFYTKDMAKAIEMVKLLVSADYEALIYTEDFNGIVVKGNYTDIDDWPRYSLPRWDE